MAIQRRGSTFHLRKRVPRRYKSIESRVTIWISLHTVSDSVAVQKAPAAWQHHIEAWEARLAGDTADAEKRFAAARELAAVRGHRYLPAARVADLSRDELLDCVESITKRAGGADQIEAAPLLGGAVEPQITVSRALDLYWQLAADRCIGKSDDQLR